MKHFIRKAIDFLRIFLVFPQVLPFSLTTERALILSDIRRWVKLLGWTGKADWVDLLTLISKKQYFINLYYYRLFKGKEMV